MTSLQGDEQSGLLHNHLLIFLSDGRSYWLGECLRVQSERLSSASCCRPKNILERGCFN